LTYIGGVSQNEVNRRLGEGHILVCTSQYEGFSNTFVQAWMRKVPVVSLNADPDNIIVREGIGFKSLTFEKLTRDVKLLIENRELREKMGKKALQYAHKNHGIEKMVNSFLSLIESPKIYL
jgi:glycosyltransferase involved in cell wall biosynthesis